jgi:preprotein translocase subunit SecA
MSGRYKRRKVTPTNEVDVGQEGEVSASFTETVVPEWKSEAWKKRKATKKKTSKQILAQEQYDLYPPNHPTCMSTSTTPIQCRHSNSKQSSNRSSKQSIKQTSKQSIKQTSKQSIIGLIDTLWCAHWPRDCH